MAFIVEDGTIVAGANAFCTVAEAREFADNRGLTLPTDDATVEQYIIQATDYVNTFEDSFRGYRVEPATQELSWPRSDVELYGEDLAETTIPKQLKQAVSRLAVDVADGVTLEPTTNGQIVTKEKVGPIEQTFANHADVTGYTDTQTTFKSAMNLLKPLFKDGQSATGGGFIGQVCR